MDLMADNNFFMRSKGLIVGDAHKIDAPGKPLCLYTQVAKSLGKPSSVQAAHHFALGIEKGNFGLTVSGHLNTDLESTEFHRIGKYVYAFDNFFSSIALYRFILQGSANTQFEYFCRVIVPRIAKTGASPIAAWVGVSGVFATGCNRPSAIKKRWEN